MTSLLSDPATSEQIRSAVEEVLSRSAYERETTPMDMSFLQPFLEKMVKVLDAIFSPLMDFFNNMGHTSPVLYWTVMVLSLLLLVGLVTHIIWSFKIAFQEKQRDQRLAFLEEPEETHAQWEKQAREAETRGDYIMALRCLFRAAVLRLDEANKSAFRPAFTNRQYLRRYKKTSAFEPLSVLVENIDTWYGGGTCDASHYQQGREAYGRIKQTIGIVRHALNA